MGLSNFSAERANCTIGQVRIWYYFLFAKAKTYAIISSSSRYAQEEKTMKISGLQKMTLLDYPGKIACTVFLGGCNFRCPYCHNSEILDGNAPELMRKEELLAFLASRRGLLDAVCISGGEPTMQPDLPELLAQIKAMGFLTKLDTNGSRPEVLKELVSRNLLDYVAMDIKNSPARYSQTIGVPWKQDKIEESIRFLAEEHIDYELRTTVISQLHDFQSVEEMGRWVGMLAKNKKIKRWFIQPFTDRDTVMYSGLCAPDEAQLAEFVGILGCFSSHSSRRG